MEAEQLAPRFPHPPANARPAAVLICFADGENGPELLLTELLPGTLVADMVAILGSTFFVVGDVDK